MRETINLLAMYVATQTVLPLFASRRTTAIVISSGLRPRTSPSCSKKLLPTEST